MTRVVIIGGGISGLAIAWHLVQGGMNREDIATLESSSRTGGHVRSFIEAGWVVESGPNGFLDNTPATLELAASLGISSQLLASNAAAARRFIWREDRLRQIHAHPGQFLTSGILSLSGALRVALEPFVSARRAITEESVFDFASRRIGAAAAKVLVDAMVSGVFAGDSRQLELVSAFPKMSQMEREYGGLFRAMLAKKRAARKSGQNKSGGPAGPGGRLTSFKEGLETLPRALSIQLGDCVYCDAAVSKAQRDGDGYLIECADGRKWRSDALVLACPASAASRITAGLHPEMSEEIGAIAFASIAVVALAFRSSELPAIPDGFGFLAPRGEGVRMLGCLWSSSIFSHRAPPGGVLLHVMIGGAHDPAAVSLDDDGLSRLALAELQTTMNIHADPQWVRVFRHENGIAQYRPGHRARMARIRQALSTLPGAFIAGSSYEGISVNHCAEEAPVVARQIRAFLSMKDQAGARQRME